MTERFDDPLFDDTDKVDEDTEAMEVTTTLMVFAEEGYWDL